VPGFGIGFDQKRYHFDDEQDTVDADGETISDKFLGDMSKTDSIQI
jgi:hypothetical protein